MSLNSYLTRLEFNHNIHEIYLRSKLIQDFSWRLIKFEQKLNPDTLELVNSSLKVDPDRIEIAEEEIFFLEKTNQKSIQKESEYV